jgi:hypothetical protein
VDLPPLLLDLAAMRGSETAADVVCGNSAYLTELARRGHPGPVLGIRRKHGFARPGPLDRVWPAGLMVAGVGFEPT